MNTQPLGKLGKPVYDALAKMYICSIANGFRFSSRREDGRFTPALDTCMTNDEVATFIVGSTKGWFSKPVTEEFLKGKIQVHIPTSVADTFEGTIDWQLSTLTISKELFLMSFTIIGQKEDEAVCIKFEEDEPPLQEAEAVSIGPTRQQLQKKNVLKARAKAARSLFTAERLTQAYCEEFGEDTDWEGDESE
jgi:hypothetical protein